MLEMKSVPDRLSLIIFDSDVEQDLACSSLEILNMCFCSSNYLGLLHARKEGWVGVNKHMQGSDLFSRSFCERGKKIMNCKRCLLAARMVRHCHHSSMAAAEAPKSQLFWTSCLYTEQIFSLAHKSAAAVSSLSFSQRQKGSFCPDFVPVGSCELFGLSCARLCQNSHVLVSWCMLMWICGGVLFCCFNFCCHSSTEKEALCQQNTSPPAAGLSPCRCAHTHSPCLSWEMPK